MGVEGNWWRWSARELLGDWDEIVHFLDVDGFSREEGERMGMW